MSNDLSVTIRAVAPIGHRLALVSKAVNRAFDDALAAEGGSLSTWLILFAIKTQDLRNQRELAAAVGIQGATLTHHLNGLEADGLLTRQNDPGNRRIHLVAMTGKGEKLFHRLAAASVAFDQKLRTGLADSDVRVLEQLLGRLHDNAIGLDQAR
jgi:MarR family transcriptional regulator for hemolysin